MSEHSMPEDSSLEFAPRLLEALKKARWCGREYNYNSLLRGVEERPLAEKPLVSVIIALSHIDAAVLGHLTVLVTERGFPFELVLVDTAGVAQQEARYRNIADIYLEAAPESAFYTALNLGALYARAPFLLVLSDLVCPTVELVRQHFEAYHQHKCLAARGDVSEVPWLLQVPVGSLLKGGPARPWFIDIDENFSIKKSVFYSLKGFDETLHPGCGALELSIRLYKLARQGKTLLQRYLPKAQCRASRSFDYPARQTAYVKSWIMVDEKYHEQLYEYCLIATERCGN
ncbi:hypothetical protein LJC59_08055 [Desulfovibrio sp. OttesenSCG-928-A18]|nr:hypothetical protein [Desulfovibrio sp. OttesenSCG-928-A18]